MAVAGWRWMQIYALVLGELARLPTSMRKQDNLTPEERKIDDRLCYDLSAIYERFYCHIEKLNKEAERFGFETQ
jgi:hypothetical protein